MIVNSIRLLFVIPICISFGDVSKLLNPISISSNISNDPSSRVKSSALIAPRSISLDSSRFHNQSQSASVISLDISEVERNLSNALQNRYQSGGTISVKLTRHWSALSVSPNYILKIVDCMPDELSASSFIRFEVWDEGKLVIKSGEPVRIAHFVDVYVAKKKLPRGTNLSSEAFTTHSVDMLRQHAGAVPAVSSLSSFELSNSVNVGAPLKWSNLTKVNLVKRGEIVDVFASGGGIYITMKGVCLDDGVQGGTVRIKNLSSDKEFHAKVLNQNSVKVNL